MINYLPHKEIDKKRWDEAISVSSNSSACASSWFLDAVSPGWSALVTKDYSSLFPLTQRQKWGFHYLYQPHFTQQLGLFSSHTPDEHLLNEFLDAIPAHFKLIEIQLNTGNVHQIKSEGFKSAALITHHLDLNKNSETLFSGFSENIKRNTRKADKSGMSLSNDVHIEDMVKLFRKNRGKQISTLTENDYQTFVQLTDEAMKNNSLTKIGLFTDDNILHAGAVFLHSFNSYILLFSATDEIARENGAMSKIIHSFITSHAGESKFLDFEGSMDPHLARFYKGFGSREVVYLQIRKNNLPVPFRWFKK